MIGLPLNDHQCLGPITEIVAERVKAADAELTASAARFRDTVRLARHLRGLPQHDDLGDDADGPRVDACEPSQRLRIPAPDPNCVERAAWYLAAAELIDPRPVRQLATIQTPVGPHTLAIENGCPVILDPRLTRNAAEAGLFELEPGPIEMRPREALSWLAVIASEPAARQPRGPARVRNGCQALHGVLAGEPLAPDHASDALFLLALAEHEARQFGPRGLALARCTIRALSDLERQHGRAPTPPRRNVPALQLGRYRIAPNLEALGALGRVGGRLGYRAGVAALRAKLASMGVDPIMLREMEHELRREGLSLGPLATPAPMPGTLGAMTPDALAGRWLAGRIG